MVVVGFNRSGDVVGSVTVTCLFRLLNMERCISLLIASSDSNKSHELIKLNPNNHCFCLALSLSRMMQFCSVKLNWARGHNHSLPLADVNNSRSRLGRNSLTHSQLAHIDFERLCCRSNARRTLVSLLPAVCNCLRFHHQISGGEVKFVVEMVACAARPIACLIVVIGFFELTHPTPSLPPPPASFL